MTQDQYPPSEPEPAESAMEIVDGDAIPASASGPSLIGRLARGAMYGVVLIAATALLAVSAVPELANYATFVPEKDGSACHASRIGSCTTIDQVSFDESSCASTTAVAAEAAGCCSKSVSAAEASLVSADKSTPSCCASISRTSLLAKSAEAPSCCLDNETQTAEQPIDAASLLAEATGDQPVDEQGGEQRSELEPDDNEVEE